MTERVLALTDRDKLATAKRQSLMAWGFGTAAVGLVIACVGYFMVSAPAAVASKLLFARVAFGQPLTEIDALKVHAAVFGSSMVLAYGLLSIAVGIVLVLHGRRVTPTDRV